MAPRGSAEERHVPVLRDRIIELLSPALQEPGSVFLDGTLGMGGHTEAVLAACPAARAVGIDRDPQALDLAGERLAALRRPLHRRPRRVRRAAPRPRRPRAGRRGRRALRPRGLLAAAGRGRARLRLPARRAAGHADGPERRHHRGGGAQHLRRPRARADPARLRRGALRPPGRRGHRPRAPAGAVHHLAPGSSSCCKKAIPAASQKSGGHPGKRTFQALRIEVNAELEAWESALPAAVDALAVGGRIAVLSYHSLEDRLTKQLFARGARGTTPQGLPVELPEHAPYLRLLTRGAEEPSAAEKDTNPRAASARLRVAERTRATKGQHP